MVKSSLNISWMMGLREINYQFLNEGSALTTHLRVVDEKNTTVLLLPPGTAAAE